jgi:hypothetical protein
VVRLANLHPFAAHLSCVRVEISGG